MPIVTEIIGQKVTHVFSGSYELCQNYAIAKRKEHPGVKYEVRSSVEAVKHKPILNP